MHAKLNLLHAMSSARFSQEQIIKLERSFVGAAGSSQALGILGALPGHSAKLISLASSAMNGLKPDRDDVRMRVLGLMPNLACGSPV